LPEVCVQKLKRSEFPEFAAHIEDMTKMLLTKMIDDFLFIHVKDDCRSVFLNHAALARQVGENHFIMRSGDVVTDFLEFNMNPCVNLVDVFPMHVRRTRSQIEPRFDDCSCSTEEDCYSGVVNLNLETMSRCGCLHVSTQKSKIVKVWNGRSWIQAQGEGVIVVVPGSGTLQNIATYSFHWWRSTHDSDITANI
jgi:hypothetical protein